MSETKEQINHDKMKFILGELKNCSVKKYYYDGRLSNNGTRMSREYEMLSKEEKEYLKMNGYKVKNHMEGYYPYIIFRYREKSCSII